ncbi:MAG: septal ring lytic transglycosylase RlpA family lipoprotein [Gemmatimonadetes bacterium]|jgi:rare lipoprotein A|nr:septal ring lytic transglycosylase RlpA family lipoprotein [Gemmatimonadota bacterium]HCK09681.1 septal ring lytic transglycosylase RlpA family lipoprotein [Candidatus Latescibacterota bacterium]
MTGRRPKRSLTLLLLVATACTVSPRYPVPSAAPPAEGMSNLPKPQNPEPIKVSTEDAYQIGKASYYAHKFHGRQTANGEIFDMYGLSAAHRELPLGTVIRVTHLGNGRSLKLRVNDRGPFVPGRILDLSLGAAQKLDMVEEGVAEVRIDIIREP